MFTRSIRNLKPSFPLFLVFRIIVGLVLIQTPHKTDETFQGPEVAHNMVFGYGQLSWEWTFKDPIRNPAYPAYYALGYYIVALTGMDRWNFLSSLIPKIMQAFIGAGFDTVLVKMNTHFNGENSSWLLVFFNLTNWATLTYFSRTYVNSLEALLTTVAFLFWLKSKQLSTGYKLANKADSNSIDPQLISRSIAILCFVMRGTSITFWMVVWPYQLVRYRCNSFSQAIRFILKNIATILIMIGLSMGLSTVWYGRVLWTQYNFFHVPYNVVLGWSKLCGQQPFLQYFIIYQYKVFSFLVVFILYGIYSSLASSSKSTQAARLRELILITFLNMLLISFSSHKELRFMLMLLPAEFIILVRGYSVFPFKKVRRILLAVSLLISAYFFVTRNLVFKRGGIAVVNYIRDNQDISEVLYLTEPYQLPMYSHIHRNIRLIMPQASFQNAIDGTSEAIRAKADPSQYLSTLTAKLGHAPQYLISTTDKIGPNHLALDSSWQLVLNQWFPSPMPEHYNRRIHLYKQAR